MSSFKVTKQIGTTSFEFNSEYNSHKELFREAGFFTSLPSKCGQCGHEDLRFHERNAETKEGRECAYYEISCQNKACEYRLQFGVHNNGKGTLFPKGWVPPYRPETDTFYRGESVSGGGGTGQGDDSPPPDFHTSDGFTEQITDQPATDGQRRMMWALAKNAGMTEGDLKEQIYGMFKTKCLDNAGDVSTKTLNMAMMEKLITALKGRGRTR